MKREGAISRIVLAALVAFSMSMPAPALAEMSTEFGSTPAQGSAEAAGTSAPAEAEKNNGLSTESSAEPNEPKDDNAKHEEARTEANSTAEAPASDSSEVPPTLKQNLKKLKSRLRPRKILRRTLPKRLGQQLLLTAPR